MSSITAGTSAGTALVHTADTTGSLLLKTGASAVTGLTIDASQNVTLANPLPVASGGTGSTSAAFVSLTSNVTGTLPIANGGTNSTATPTAGGIVYGTGTAQAVTAAGTSGQVLTSAGSGAPVWANFSAPIGTDLSATDYTLTMPTAIANTLTKPVMQAVSLDGTKQIMLFGGNASLQAVVWDGTSFGTMVLVRSGSFNTTATCAVIAISSTAVLVSSLAGSTSALETVVLSISGTTITVNTAVATTLAGNSSLIAANTRFVACGSSYVLNYYNASNFPSFRAITVSGVTPTVGAELALASGTQSYPHSYAYTSSVLLSLSSDATTVYAQPISVSGTTLTAGTRATLTASDPRIVSGVLSTGRVAIAYGTAGNSVITCSIISVTGTVASTSTAATTIPLVTIFPVMQIYGSQAFVLSGTNSTDQLGLLTDTAGVATVGTPVSIGVAARMVGYLSSGKVFLAATSASNSDYYQYGISGSTVVLEKTFPNVAPASSVTFSTSNYYSLPLSGPSQSGNGSPIVLVYTSSGKFAIPTQNSSSQPFTTSIDGTSIAKLQQNPFNLSSATYNDGISTTTCWGVITLQAGSTTTLQIKRIVLS